MITAWPVSPAYDAVHLWRGLAFAMRPLSAHQPGAVPASDQPTDDTFEAFFWRYERRIFGYLWRMTGEEQSAFDLTQETFLRAWQHFHELTGQREPAPWLFRTATNLALTHLRQRLVHPATSLTMDDPGASDPGRRIVERDAVRRALLKLAPNQRGALVLHEVYGFSCEEVGVALGLSRDAVKMALWRGRTSFRTHYLAENQR